MIRILEPGRSGEVATLTGARQRDSQKKALTKMGIPFSVAPDGWARVFHENALPAKRSIDDSPAKSSEPAFDRMEGYRD